MKKLFAKFNELQKMLFLAVVIAIGLALISLLPLFLAHQPGWLIGIGIGSVIEILNIFLLYKGSEYTLKSFKTYMFLLFYFLRMLLFIVGFVVAALLSFGLRNYFAPIPEFANSLWGVLIAYTPTQIIVIVVMAKSKKSVLTISENLHKENE